MACKGREGLQFNDKAQYLIREMAHLRQGNAHGCGVADDSGCADWGSSVERDSRFFFSTLELPMEWQTKSVVMVDTAICADCALEVEGDLSAGGHSFQKVAGRSILAQSRVPLRQAQQYRKRANF